MSIKITGTGCALPEYVLSNNALTNIVDTNDEWITTRTGIKERRILTTETLKDLAVKAAKNAIHEAKVQPEELDMIICSTVHGEYLVPSMACLIQAEINANCPAFDINAACTGFIYGLDVAKAFIDGNNCKKILLVSAESMSQVNDYTDRTTCVLFGDGAGAVVLEKGNGLLGLILNAKGNDKILKIPNTKGNCPLSDHSNELKPYLVMNGQEVYKFAVKSINNDITKVLSESNESIDDIDYFLIHQANDRIVEAARNKLKIPVKKILKNIQKYGNTSAACIPIMLNEFISQGIIKKGMKLVLSAFGGGLTSGAAIIKI